MSQISTYGKMPATRSRQLPFNSSPSHTLQKQRQLEDTISEDSDSVPLGRDIIFIFANLSDSGLANSFTLKKKGWESPALQGDYKNSEDSNLLDSGNFNDDEVDDYLGNIDKQVLTWNIIITISTLANTMKCRKYLQIKVKDSNSFDDTNSWKLINFISQCQLTFCAFPDVYHDDDQKVSFIITYLCRATLDFFEPYLIDPIDISDW